MLTLCGEEKYKRWSELSSLYIRSLYMLLKQLRSLHLRSIKEHFVAAQLQEPLALTYADVCGRMLTYGAFHGRTGSGAASAGAVPGETGLV
jgi:hypothetical protein